MTQQARLVIVGAGIVGCSAAYHLAQHGWRDMIILDKGNGATLVGLNGIVIRSHGSADTYAISNILLYRCRRGPQLSCRSKSASCCKRKSA